MNTVAALSDYAPHIALTLLHFLWQGLAVAAVALVLAWVLRNGPARRRYAVWLTALLIMAACPVLTFAYVSTHAVVSGPLASASVAMPFHVAAEQAPTAVTDSPQTPGVDEPAPTAPQYSPAASADVAPQLPTPAPSAATPEEEPALPAAQDIAPPAIPAAANVPADDPETPTTAQTTPTSIPTTADTLADDESAAPMPAQIESAVASTDTETPDDDEPAGATTAQAMPATAYAATETGADEPALPTTAQAAPASTPATIDTPAPAESAWVPPWLTHLRDYNWRAIAHWVCAAYLAGVLMFMLRLSAGLYGGHRLRRAAAPIADPAVTQSLGRRAHQIGLRRVPRVFECARTAVPTVVGLLRPIVLLPAAVVTGMTPAQLDLLLLHELAHIRRYDPLVNVLQRVIEALLFFHPAVWFVSRRVRIEREHCCDDLVIALTGGAVPYAETLLRAAELSTGRAVPSTAVAAGTPSQLRRRVHRLLGTAPPAVKLTRLGLLGMIAVILIAAGGLTALAVSSSGGEKNTNQLEVLHPPKYPGESEITPFQLAQQVKTELAAQPGPPDEGEEVSSDEPTNSSVPSRELEEHLKALSDNLTRAFRLQEEYQDNPDVANALDAAVRAAKSQLQVISETNDPGAMEYLMMIDVAAVPNTALQIAIIEAFEAFRNPAAIERLAVLLNATRTPSVASRAADALARFEWNLVKPVVTPLLQDTHGGWRTGAYEVLARVDNPEAKRLLFEYGLSETGVMRRDLVETLAANVTDETRPLFDQALQNNDTDRAGTALLVLSRVADERAIETILQALDREPVELDEPLIQALAELDDPRIFEALAQRLPDVSWDVGLAIAGVLREHGHRPEDPKLLAHYYAVLGAWDVLPTLGEAALPALEAALRVEKAAIVADAAEALGYTGSAAAVEPLTNLTTHPAPEVRRAAVEALRELDATEAAPVVAGALRDTDNNVRAAAAWALQPLGSEAEVPALAAALRDRDVNVRRAAVEALGAIGGDDAVEALVRVTREDPHIREVAVDALRATGAESAEEALISLLDAEGELWPQAMFALWQMKSEAAVPALIEALDAQDSSYVARAAQALGEIGDPRAIPRLNELAQWPRAGHAVRRMTTDINAAREALQKMGADPQSMRDKASAETSPDTNADTPAPDATTPEPTEADVAAAAPAPEAAPEAESAALTAWTQWRQELGDEAAIETVLQALDKGEIELDEPLVRALAEVDDARLFDALALRLPDASWEVREAIADAFDVHGYRSDEPGLLAYYYVARQAPEVSTDGNRVTIRAVPNEGAWEVLPTLGDAALPALEDALTHPSAFIVVPAAEALGYTGSEAAVAPLTGILRHQNSQVREAAVRALIQLDAKEAAPEIANALRDPDAAVRYAAAQALQTLGTEAQVPALTAALRDRNEDVRRAAVQALGAIGGGEVVQPFARVVREDEDSDVRQLAVNALGAIGGSEAVEPLARAAMDDEDRFVRRDAVRALRSIGGNEVVEPLARAAREDDEYDVRELAVEALGLTGAEEAVPVLLEFLAEGNPLNAVAAEALGKLKGKADEAVPALSKAVHFQNFDWNVPIAALGEIGTPAAIAALHEIADQSSGMLRVSARQALLKAGIEPPETRSQPPAATTSDETAETEASMPEARVEDTAEDAPAVTASDETASAVAGIWNEWSGRLTDEDWWLRKTAVEQIAGASTRLPPDARASWAHYLVPAFTKALKDPDPRVQAAAAEALGKAGYPQAIPHLVAALKTKDSVVRQESAAALANYDHPAVAELLAVALVDADPDVREGAVEGLHLWGGTHLEAALPVALAALEQPMSEAADITRSLVALYPAETLLPHALLFLDKDETVLTGVSMLAELGTPAAKDALLAFAQERVAQSPAPPQIFPSDPTAEQLAEYAQRQAAGAAVDALAPYASEDVTAQMVEWLHHPDPLVWQAAARTLKSRGYSAKDTGEQVRLDLANIEERFVATASLRQPAAAPALVSLLSMPNDDRGIPGVHEYAAQFISDPSSVPVLRDLIRESAEIQVDDAAFQAVRRIAEPETALRMLLKLSHEYGAEHFIGPVQPASVVTELLNPSSLPIALEGLSTPDPAIRQQLAAALGRYENLDPLNSLIGLLDDPALDVRTAAANAIVELINRVLNVEARDYGEVIHAVVQRDDLTQSQKEGILRAAVIVGSGDKSVLSALENLLADESQAHLHDAARAALESLPE